MGMVGGALNLFFIYKFIRILTTPFGSTDAFKLGIVDESGKILRKHGTLKTIEEKEAYTIMHRMVWKLKRLMEKIPFGKSRLASYAAALWLIKEESTFKGTDKELQESFLSFLETDWKTEALILKENYEGDMDKKTFKNLKRLKDISLSEGADKDTKGDKEAYQKFFKATLKKFGVDEPDQLKGDKKKEFFDAIDKGWKGDNEKPEPGDKKESFTKFKESFELGTQEYLDHSKNVTPGETVGIIEADKEALKRALAISIWKKAGGKVDKQPENIEKWWGQLSPADRKRAENLAQYKKEKKAQKEELKMSKLSLKQKKALANEHVTEAKGTAYPATIDTLKMIVREKQNQIVMFKSGQARVDLFTASAMVQVYDAMKPATKKKFEIMIKNKGGFMKTQAFAMKMMEDTRWYDNIKEMNQSFENLANERQSFKTLFSSPVKEPLVEKRSLRPSTLSRLPRVHDKIGKFMVEGRAKQDPNYVPPATDKDKNRTGLRALVDAQKKHYSAQDIQSIARKYKIKLPEEPVGGKTWDWDWEIVAGKGISLSYRYGLNSTFIKGWKFDKQKAGIHLAKYGNDHETIRDMKGSGGKVQVTGLESAFELIGENFQSTLTLKYPLGEVSKVELGEDAPANSVSGGNVNLDPFKKKRKNAKIETESFGGSKVFVVSPQRFYDSRLGKSRYSRYEKYVGNDKLGEAIRNYGRTNPKESIILKNSGNGAMLYLKYGKGKG